MTRSVVAGLVLAFGLYAVSNAGAHHSHPYFYDQCTTITIEGRVESVRWIDPHTLVVLRLDDGTAYTVDWSPVSRLTNTGAIGAAKAALVAGARIAVTGNPIRTSAEIRERFPDYLHEVNPNTVDPTLIRRVDDIWVWSRTAGDRMPGSASSPCPEPKD